MLEGEATKLPDENHLSFLSLGLSHDQFGNGICSPVGSRSQKKPLLRAAAAL